MCKCVNGFDLLLCLFLSSLFQLQTVAKFMGAIKMCCTIERRVNVYAVWRIKADEIQSDQTRSKGHSSKPHARRLTLCRKHHRTPTFKHIPIMSTIDNLVSSFCSAQIGRFVYLNSAQRWFRWIWLYQKFYAEKAWEVKQQEDDDKKNRMKFPFQNTNKNIHKYKHSCMVIYNELRGSFILMPYCCLLVVVLFG